MWPSFSWWGSQSWTQDSGWESQGCRCVNSTTWWLTLQLLGAFCWKLTQSHYVTDEDIWQYQSKTGPCGTPLVTNLYLDIEPLTTILLMWLTKQILINQEGHCEGLKGFMEVQTALRKFRQLRSAVSLSIEYKSLAHRPLGSSGRTCIWWSCAGCPESPPHPSCALSCLLEGSVPWSSHAQKWGWQVSSSYSLPS